jgi:hypothetical protein
VTMREEYERAARKIDALFDELREVRRVLTEIVDSTVEPGDRGVALANIRQAALTELGRLKRWIGL